MKYYLRWYVQAYGLKYRDPGYFSSIQISEMIQKYRFVRY
jgi:hypothetical protein